MFSTMNNKPMMRSNLNVRGMMTRISNWFASYSGGARKTRILATLVAAGLFGTAMSAPAMAACIICNPDGNGGYRCVFINANFNCDDRGAWPSTELCFDLPVLAVTAPIGSNGPQPGLHPGLNNSGVIGTVGAITVLAGADGRNTAYRLNEANPNLIEVATLPQATDLNALGPVLTGMQFVGYEIQLPSFVVGYEPETVTNGDFAIYFVALDPATMEVIDTRIEPVETASLQFTVLGPTCAGADTNWDGQINLMDLAVVLANFGNPGTQSEGDLDADGTVGLSDLSSLLTYFGSSCQ